MKSASNKELTLLRKLKQRKHREKEGLFVVEGLRAVEQVIANGYINVKRVFIIEGKEEIIDLKTATVCVINKEDSKDIFDTESPQGVIAICEVPEEASLDSLLMGKGVIIALDRIQDPGNAGTIIRTAAWFGVGGMLLGEGTVDIFNPKVSRSTMGALGSIPFVTGKLDDALKYLEGKGWKVLLLDGNEGAVSIGSIPKTEKLILVVGNEANGIATDLINESRERVMISASASNNAVESLNAAVALSIAVYHMTDR